jgi:hypothetical protein
MPPFLKHRQRQPSGQILTDGFELITDRIPSCHSPHGRGEWQLAEVIVSFGEINGSDLRQRFRFRVIDLEEGPETGNLEYILHGSLQFSKEELPLLDL